jgi:hypothetical protein
MKTSLVFLFFLMIFSGCTKEKNNYDVKRTIFLKDISCPDTAKPSSHMVEFPMDDKTDNEMLADIHMHTFSKWIMPYDTIWLYNGSSDGGNRKIGWIYSDSVFEKSIESACPSFCPQKAFLNIYTDNLKIIKVLNNRINQH